MTPYRTSSLTASCALLLSALALGDVASADDLKPRAAPSADAANADSPSRYCADFTPSAQEARIAWQMKQLLDLEARVKQRVADIEKAEASIRDWVDKRDAMLKSANDEVVAIYAKMQAETAAQQIALLDDPLATAILAKLKPAAAGAILDQMDAARAARLANLLSGPKPQDKKT